MLRKENGHTVDDDSETKNGNGNGNGNGGGMSESARKNFSEFFREANNK